MACAGSDTGLCSCADTESFFCPYGEAAVEALCGTVSELDDDGRAFIDLRVASCDKACGVVCDTAASNVRGVVCDTAVSDLRGVVCVLADDGESASSNASSWSSKYAAAAPSTCAG
jgi:hypothetical protein